MTPQTIVDPATGIPLNPAVASPALPAGQVLWAIVALVGIAVFSVVALVTLNPAGSAGTVATITALITPVVVALLGALVVKQHGQLNDIKVMVDGRLTQLLESKDSESRARVVAAGAKGFAAGTESGTQNAIAAVSVPANNMSGSFCPPITKSNLCRPC